MKNQLLALLLCLPLAVWSQSETVLTDELAEKLIRLPMHCIPTEYPNKTGHIINGPSDAVMTPKELHPAFFGCLDWHSSVHGHWMLVRMLKTKPHLAQAEAIEKQLETSFEKEKLEQEAAYFSQFQLAGTFERTYGWAWLLKLDEELLTWNDPRAKRWHQNLQPLTRIIVEKWKAYLPKQTYPNRTGVHPNTAFALAFAMDWAKHAKQQDFENQLREKALYFYGNDRNTPAYLEPDGSDFFSPSLNIAYLMSRILPQKEFQRWLRRFYTPKGLENVMQIPKVSDLEDYQTVHLVGLSFSRAWCFKGIAKALPEKNPQRKHFETLSQKFITNGLPLLFQSNYGGDHWLASFAVYALKDEN
ncbi:DUF2891 domain-containing protein [Bergeyella sp. RCAD1439]|uniref:DUF2891 domain-containing protein n=1 Tax=Bergeyella anatis TaxID=3113737 RepID=UPI002E18D9AE|nr:DUF2891 domain-containing protein [Bergeyella sp. RCAD1439]